MVEDVRRIEISWLKRHAYLLPGYRHGTIEWISNMSDRKSSIYIRSEITDHDSSINLRYSQIDRLSGKSEDFNYSIKLTSTPCQFGGRRLWFVCPLTLNGQPCSRRVGVLYKDGDYFGCRQCCSLTYRSRNENRRSNYFAFGEWLRLEEQLEQGKKNIKRVMYAGKPTKGYQKWQYHRQKLDCLIPKLID